MKKDKKTIGVIVLIAIAAVAALSLLLHLTDGFGLCRTRSKMRPFIKGGSYIAALFIEGVIEEENELYNQQWLLDTIQELKDDSRNLGIALFIDSPGGSVYESDEAYLALQDYRTTGRPIYVYQEHMAASGAYYISCAGTKIYANRNTLTGSIGVIFSTSFDMTGLLEKLGIKSETITSGSNKNMFSFNEPVTPEQRKIMQDITDECYDQFVGIVAMNRNIPLFSLKKLADGRLYTAKQALENNLIDAIGSSETMLDDMMEEQFDGEDVPVIDFYYNYEPSLVEFLMNNLLGTEAASALRGAASRMQPRKPAYLYTDGR